MKRLEEFLFYFFLVALPFSLRHIFGYSPVGFMEWKAVSIYGTDILLAALLVLSRFNFFRFKKTDWLLVGFIGWSFLSVLWAIDRQITLFVSIKLAELVLFFWYLRNYARQRFEPEKIYMALVVGGVFQSVVAILQFSLQHSLGLKYFGESILSPSMTGVAAFISGGVKVIRAYGTTPHPNVLAAYLVVSLVGYWLLYPLFKKSYAWQAVYVLLLWGLLVTFSRTVIALAAVLFLVWAIREFKNYKRLVVLSLIVAGVFLTIYWPYVVNRVNISGNDEAVTLRVLYNHEATSGHISWLGVGAGNFVPWLMTQRLSTTSIGLPADEYQPVHNIYLLIYKELGLIGLGIFILWLVMLFHGAYDRQRIVYAGLFGVFLVLGLFDHFLWTIQAGQLLFWLSAGLIASNGYQN